MDKPLVLIIDDEEYIRDMLRIKLESTGFSVKEAADGISGIDIAKEFQPSVILLDMVMPGLTGIETLEKLKENETTKNLKVFIFTGQGLCRPDINEVSNRFALEEGAIGFIRKETDLSELVEKLKETVKS